MICNPDSIACVTRKLWRILQKFVVHNHPPKRGRTSNKFGVALSSILALLRLSLLSVQSPGLRNRRQIFGLALSRAWAT